MSKCMNTWCMNICMYVGMYVCVTLRHPCVHHACIGYTIMRVLQHYLVKVGDHLLTPNIAHQSFNAYQEKTQEVSKRPDRQGRARKDRVGSTDDSGVKQKL